MSGDSLTENGLDRLDENQARCCDAEMSMTVHGAHDHWMVQGDRWFRDVRADESGEYVERIGWLTIERCAIVSLTLDCRPPHFDDGVVMDGDERTGPDADGRVERTQLEWAERRRMVAPWHRHVHGRRRAMRHGTSFADRCHVHR